MICKPQGANQLTAQGKRDAMRERGDAIIEEGGDGEEPPRLA